MTQYSGMFALSQTVNLSAAFLKNRAASLKVLFNSLLSSGDFVTLVTSSLNDNPNEIRLSAINCKDTLTSKNEYTRLSVKEPGFITNHKGRLLKLDVTPEQLDKFIQLIGKEDIDVTHFLFAIAYASQALFRCINNPLNDIEKEIDDTISKNPSISPFYHSLDIRIPSPFPVFNPVGVLDYSIYFEREKPSKLYSAFVHCEHHGKLVFQAHYKLMGIADKIILRMAKEIKHHPVV
jgi:hypothetical protein